MDDNVSANVDFVVEPWLVATHLPHQGGQGPQVQGLEECIRIPGALSIGSPDNMHETRISMSSDQMIGNSNIKLFNESKPGQGLSYLTGVQQWTYLAGWKNIQLVGGK